MTPNPDQITAHFHRSEFDQFARHGFPRVPYPDAYLATLRTLCKQLEIIRYACAAPLTVLSGYRTAEYNAHIGGADHSQHLVGAAADLLCPTLRAPDLYALIRGLISVHDVKIGGIGSYPTFVHVDVRPGKLMVWQGLRTLV